MKSERPIRGLACRWCAVVGIALLGSLLSASAAQAQVQTFFVLMPEELQPDESEAYEECAERLSAALVNTDAWRATADIETQRTVQNCVGDLASPAADRECKLSLANITVDWLLKLNSRRIGGEWKWGVKALSPDEGGAQKWGGDEIPAGVNDRTRAAYEACDALGKQFACSQGVSSACVGSGFGAGPILGAEAAAPSQGSGPTRAQPARARMSALEVNDPMPQVVSVWIDGREAGTSANQVTGIPPGKHEVTIKATGYFDHVEQLAFAADVPTVIQGVRLRKTTATLRVEMVEPAVATVFIGGRERGSTERLLAGIAPGEAEVVLRAEGYRDLSGRVTFEADSERRLTEIRLEPLPAMLTVTANILGAEVVVDGAVVGTTTGEADPFEVAPTAKQLEVRRSGYSPLSWRLSLQPGGAAEVSAELSRVQAAPAAPAAGASSGATGGCPAGYVRIAPGTFMMGSPPGEEGRYDVETQHSVTISRAYCMKATEVTQGEWQAVMGSNPSHFKNCGANCPVEKVSWDDAVGYANALSRREGLPECYAGSTFAGLGCSGYRLPTEAEWEYAARAGTTAATYGNLDSVAWYDKNSGSATHPVGQKQPNAWGLYDMLGNVLEWTGDWYGTYPGRVTDPLGAGAGSSRVIRGGSWGYYARGARAADRIPDTPGYRGYYCGFRLALTAP
jgi:formylglycine-generating enzyme required for sulfatase activity